MKSVLILSIMVISMLNAKGMYNIGDGDILIKGNGESCNISINSKGKLTHSDCKILTNSKNIRIFCTKRKKMCKTFDEVLIFSGKGSRKVLSYQECLDAGDTTVALRECNGKELTYQDGLLNKYYKQAMRQLSTNEKKTLRKAQRAWIKYRDRKCDSEASEVRGGTAEPVVYGGCLVDMTTLRAKELKRMNGVY